MDEKKKLTLEELNKMPHKMLRIGEVEIPEDVYMRENELGIPNEIVNVVLTEAIQGDDIRHFVCLSMMIMDIPFLLPHYYRLVDFLDTLELKDNREEN